MMLVASESSLEERWSRLTIISEGELVDDTTNSFLRNVGDPDATNLEAILLGSSVQLLPEGFVQLLFSVR